MRWLILYSSEMVWQGASKENKQHIILSKKKKNEYFLVMLICLIQALRCFQQSFSHTVTVSGCDREVSAHF